MKKAILGAWFIVLGFSVSAWSRDAAVPAPAGNKIATPAEATPMALARATALAQQPDQPPAAVVAAFVAVIESDRDFLPAHEALLKFAAGLRTAASRKKELQPAADLVAKAAAEKYAEWEKEFPDSVGINFGLGSRYYEAEDPRAKSYLLKAVAREPGLARVWSMLSTDAARWGDQSGVVEYLLKASQAEPANPDYAFAYASELRSTAPEKWEAASLEIARRFPTSERGAQALYWLGQRSADDAKRIAFWEQARVAFPPAKFNWTRDSMTGLFNAYLRTTPDRAITLARDMTDTLDGENRQGWAGRLDFAQAFQAVRTLADLGNFNEALVVLDKLPVSRRSANPGLTQLLKAEVLAGAGKVQAAYDSIAERFASSPEDELQAVLLRYGAQLGKTGTQIDADVWAVRTAAAKPAPAFDLGLYTSEQKVSLASLRGKVVFITFWFPGCGPCRGEFPHFENVVAKFRGNPEVVYLGINGLRNQDAYVLPFMEGTKYSFIPLKGDKAVTGNEGYAVRAYPSNFLIGRDGRIVFANFRTDDLQSEIVLQRMIESLLARPAGA
ncbi:MAG: redoxin protein [Lacunisphaera sp.]|nr:redoxin protein [Lacunisphaera sp.]